MIRRFAPLLLLAVAAASCSGGGGGGGKAEVEIFPPAADVVTNSEANASATFSALVDGEPADVQWYVVGGGFVDVTDGPTTTYYAPEEGILAEPISVSLFAFADGGEGEAAITLRDSAGLLDVVYENYDVFPDAGLGSLVVELLHVETNTVYDYIDGSRQELPVSAGTYRSSDETLAPQYVTWGDVGVAGEYVLLPDTTTVPDDGAATLHVRWADGGTGFLWAATDTSSLLGFDGPSLLPEFTDAGQTRVASAAGPDRRLYDIVDTDDRMWAADEAQSSICGYGAATLGTANNADPGHVAFDAVLVGGTASIAAPIGVAFDATTGDLYYANAGNDTFARFSAAQLTAGGAVAPDAFFGNLARTGVSAIAVDPDGNVWLADADTATIDRFDAADLATSGTPVPAAVFSGPWTGPLALTFDANGSLWIGDTSAEIHRVDAGQLVATGVVAVTPDLTLDGAVIGGQTEALVFDDAGDLWIADGANGEIDRIVSSQIMGTGTVTVDTTFATLPAPGVTGIAFRRWKPAP